MVSLFEDLDGPYYFAISVRKKEDMLLSKKKKDIHEIFWKYQQHITFMIR